MSTSRMSCETPLVSVIICTWNRASSMRDCLFALSKQTSSRDSFEILVIDNNSTDNTREVVDQMRLSTGMSIAYVMEVRPGVAAARNTGVAQASGEILCFLDDDSVPPHDYLQTLMDSMNNTGADLLAGKVICIKPEGLQSDIPASYLRKMNISGLDLGSDRRLMKHGESGVTANMAVRKTLLVKLGRFNECLGYVGNRKISGEDTEICDRASRAGAIMIWDPDCVVDHCPQATRFTKDSCRQAAYFLGIGRLLRQFGGSVPALAGLRIILKSVVLLAVWSILYVLMLWNPGYGFKTELKLRKTAGKLVAVIFNLR